MLKKRFMLFLALCWYVQMCFAQNAAPAAAVVPITKEPSHHLVLENEYVRVFKVEVGSHSETLYHQHDVDYVFVTLGDSDVESVRVGEPPVRLQLKDGETRFSKGGFAHKAVNRSDKSFRNFTIELKKSPGQINCGGGPENVCDWSVGGSCPSPVPLLSASNLSISRESVCKIRHHTENADSLYILIRTTKFDLGSPNGPAITVEPKGMDFSWFKKGSEAVFEGEPDIVSTYVVLRFPTFGDNSGIKK